MTLGGPVDLPRVVAESRTMRDLFAVLERIAGAGSPVLLQGESGTGKDLAAHWLHVRGPRRDAPFVKLHCPSIPEDLLESELFGHERGAFTDARRAKPGKIEMANGGTLYLDQVHDLTPSLQAKLLRVVEEMRFERLGGTRTIEVDVRVVSSSTVALRDAVAAKTFREDLYHRLSVIPVALPPLRDHRDDVLPLATAFLARERERGTTKARGFEEAAADLLLGYDWPGNVRELRAAVERAALLGGQDLVPVAALPPHLLERPSALWTGRRRRLSLRDVERAYIRYVLEDVSGRQGEAAAILGISRKALWEKRRRFGLP
jgi:two-component system, NtrC family, response regulator AtoC